MKRIISLVLLTVMALAVFPVSVFSAGENFLIGDWTTSDGMELSFYDDGTFYLDWGWGFMYEEGDWYAESLSSDTFVIEMDGSYILSMMSTLYGVTSSDYHFEILKCNNDNFYLVQVYDDYTAKSSPCKLPFTRYGATADFRYDPEDNKDYQHILHSDNERDCEFVFKKGEEIEDLLFSMDWGVYNPRLAHFLGVMSRAAYTESILEENYNTLGFTDLTGDYHQSAYASYKMGRRRLDDGRVLYFITIQGSESVVSNPDQWRNNIDYDTTPQNRHEGFHRSSDRILQSILKDLGGSIDDNTIFIITGHSLGAAAANLLSVELYEYGIPKENLYCYCFACPNVAVGHTDPEYWTGNGNYANIFSIEHKWDSITCVPTNDWFNFSDWRWKRYGQSLWFDEHLGFAVDKWNAHNMYTYLDFLEHEYDLSHFCSTEYTIKAFSSRCPVDLTVYDNKGEPIVGVYSGIADYYGKTAGESALVIVDGDDKAIYVFDDGDLNVQLVATDNGSMDFSLGRIGLFEGTITERKDFNDINLYSDKKMVCNFTEYEGAADVKLFVVDENDNVKAEIMEDGSEVSTDKETDAPPDTDKIPDTAEQTDTSEQSEATGSPNVWKTLIFIIVPAFVIIIAVLIVIIIKKRK